VRKSIPSLTKKSTLLAAVALFFSVLTLVDRPQSAGAEADEILVASLNPDHVSRIELSSASAKTILARDAQTETWSITAPIEHKADSTRIAQLLAAFRNRIVADVTLDEGNLKDYGLDAAKGIVVELWTDDNAPAASFTIGDDMEGGSSFVRVSGDSSVYRARIGGRQRFARDPLDWRNRVVIDRREADIQGVRIEPWDGEVIHMVRHATEDDQGQGPWTLDPDPGWELSAEDLSLVVQKLGQMRAANILDDDFDGGFSPPAANITIMDKDGAETTLAIGRRSEGGVAFVRLSGGSGVYAVPAQDIALFTSGAAAVPSMVMFEIDESEIDRLIYYQRKTKVEVARHPESGVWQIASPAGLKADVAEVNFVVRQLARPKGEEEAGEIPANRTGLKRPRMVFEVQRKDGSHEALYVGRHFRNDHGAVFFWVKAQSSDKVYVMSENTLTRLRAGFGQR
jgi:hypothetical protein